MHILSRCAITASSPPSQVHKTAILNGNHQPIINVVASLIAILMLVSGPVRDDSIQTFFSAHPVDRLLFRKHGSHRRRRMWLRDLLFVTPLQLAWAVRALLTPTLAVLGTAMALASAESAVDIVLNSVAIGFIFEFDDALYTILLTAPDRRRYEDSPPEPGTCLAVPGSPYVAEWYTWLIAAADFSICTLAYLKIAFDFDWSEGHWVYGMWQLAALVWLRAGASAAAGIHLSLRARAHKYKTYAHKLKRFASNKIRQAGSRSTTEEAPTCWKVLARVSFECLRVVLSAGVAMASAAFVIKYCYGRVGDRLAFSTACMEEGSELDLCLNSYTKSGNCSSGRLDWKAPGSSGGLYMDYSYEEVFWSQRDWGPFRAGCTPRWKATNWTSFLSSIALEVSKP